MPDKPNVFPDEEYRFPDDDASNPLNPDDSLFSETEIPVEERKSEQIHKVRRYTLFIIGLIALIIIVYKLLGFFFGSSHNEAQNPAKVQPLPAESKPITSAARPPVQNPLQLQQPISASQSDNQSKELLAKMEVKSSAMESRIEGLKQSVESLQSNLNTMSSEISQLNASVTMLTQKINEQAEKISRAQKKPVSGKAARQVKPVRLEHYTVKAVIPGRAWLKSSNGATITVGHGTPIPGYGKVMVIDPQRGEVVMTSGKIIEYGPDDR